MGDADADDAAAGRGRVQYFAGGGARRGDEGAGGEAGAVYGLGNRMAAVWSSETEEDVGERGAGGGRRREGGEGCEGVSGTEEVVRRSR